MLVYRLIVAGHSRIELFVITFYQGFGKKHTVISCISGHSVHSLQQTGVVHGGSSGGPAGYFHIQRHFSKELLHLFVLIAVRQRNGHSVLIHTLVGRCDKTVHRLQVYANVAVLKQLVVIEVTSGKIRIQRYQPVILTGRIRKSHPTGTVRCQTPIHRYLALRRPIVLLGRGILAHLILDIGAVHVGVGEIRIKFYRLGQILHRILIASHLSKEY